MILRDKLLPPINEVLRVVLRVLDGIADWAREAGNVEKAVAEIGIVIAGLAPANVGAVEGV